MRIDPSNDINAIGFDQKSHHRSISLPPGEEDPGVSSSIGAGRDETIFCPYLYGAVTEPEINLDSHLENHLEIGSFSHVVCLRFRSM